MSFLYRDILGSRFGQLPEAVRQLHSVEVERRYRGICEVRRGQGFLSRLCADLLSLPKAGKSVEVTVHLLRSGKKEFWTRHFDGRPFRSSQSQAGGMLHEKLRFATLVFALDANTEGLSLNLRQVYLFGLPVGVLLRPRVLAKETQVNGEFHFHIRTTLPGLGLLVEYEGTLTPDA